MSRGRGRACRRTTCRSCHRPRVSVVGSRDARSVGRAGFPRETRAQANGTRMITAFDLAGAMPKREPPPLPRVRRSLPVEHDGPVWGFHHGRDGTVTCKCFGDLGCDSRTVFHVHLVRMHMYDHFPMHDAVFQDQFRVSLVHERDVTGRLQPHVMLDAVDGVQPCRVAVRHRVVVAVSVGVRCSADEWVDADESAECWV
jgi:hypothetical protein